MAFYGSSFIYDGTPSEMYGLVLANIGGSSQSAGNIGGELVIHEDRTNRRSTGLHYGTTANEPLSFPVVFTVCDDNRWLDRYDIAAIAAWLTGHGQYKQLAICQPDMEGIYYRALITELVAQEVGMHTIGFTATVTCDGPYAYRTWPSSKIAVEGDTTLLYRNMSNVNDYYRPKIDIVCSGSEFSIENKTDGSRFSISGMPAADRTITVDCLNQVITSSDGINLYQYWNRGAQKVFPRFVRGDNELVLSGHGSATIHNEFPWNIGC